VVIIIKVEKAKFKISLSDNMLEDCHPLGDNGYVKTCFNEANHSVVSGSKL
jgi:hypothetical protein